MPSADLGAVIALIGVLSGVAMVAGAFSALTCLERVAPSAKPWSLEKIRRFTTKLLSERKEPVPRGDSH